MIRRASGRTNCSAAADSANRSRCRRSSRGCRPNGCAANTKRSASSCPAIRSTTTPPCSRNCACSPGRNFSRAVKTGATAGRVAGTVVSRQERRTRTGSKMGIIGLSDPTGHYEAVIFSEGLAEHRDLLEPGTAVLAVPVGRGAGRRGARAHPVGRAARCRRRQSRTRACACSCATTRRSKRWPSGWSRSRARPPNGDGEVSMVLMLEQGTEVEVKLPGRFKVSPQIAGAIKARARRGAGRGIIAPLVAAVRYGQIKHQAEDRHPDRHRRDRQQNLNRRLAAA